jgi:hypothetical protein
LKNLLPVDQPGRLALKYAAAGAALLAVVAGWLLWQQRPDWPSLELQDYVEYWGAGRLNLAGKNPYDAEALYAVERQANPELTEAIMMWNPPCTLSLTLPFTVLPLQTGRWLWLLSQLGILLWCADRIWRMVRGRPECRWLAWLLCLALASTFFVLRMGQISACILLGVVAFLDFEQRGRDYWAGVALALVGLKPHLLLPFELVLALWILHQRRWRVLAGAILAVGALSMVPLFSNGTVFSQYWEAIGQRPPQMYSPTLGTLLRLALGAEHFRLQFLPAIVAMVAVTIYWWQHRKTWVWLVEAPWLMLISFLAAPYGAWPFDVVVLLVPLIKAAACVEERREKALTMFAVAGYLGFDVMALLLQNVHYSQYYWYAWMAPYLAYLYWTLTKDRACDDRAALQPVVLGTES